MTEITLAAKVRNLVFEAGQVVKESEDRQQYRAESGRHLSPAHAAALQGLGKELRELAGRIDMLVAPPADVAALKADYEALKARLEE